MHSHVRAGTALAALASLALGCASYRTPGAPANLAAIDRSDIRREMEREPAARFPARIAIARVQALDYRSWSYRARAPSAGDFCVLTVQELLREAQLEHMSAWPRVAAAAPLSRLLMPARMNGLDDLRLAAAKLQSDVLLLYTLDTQFEVRRKSVLPTGVLSLGLAPDRDARVSATASALLVDVRSGFVYGTAESTAHEKGLASYWSSNEQIDARRIEAEQAAFDGLVVELEKTWRAVAREHAEPERPQLATESL